jgi:hypothetical protein
MGGRECYCVEVCIKVDRNTQCFILKIRPFTKYNASIDFAYFELPISLAAQSPSIAFESDWV